MNITTDILSWVCMILLIVSLFMSGRIVEQHLILSLLYWLESVAFYIIMLKLFEKDSR